MKQAFSIRAVSMCLLAIALASGSLLAQTSAGALVGLVRDAAGAAIPNAKVTVTNTETNITSRLETDASGNYSVPSVPPGIYSVACEHPGFKRITVEPVTVSVNQTVRVDLSLPVGDASESVTVQEYTSLVQTDNATIGQVVTTRELTELPLNGRDFRNLLSLNPGVTQPHDGIATSASIRLSGFNDSLRLDSINGARPSSVSYLVDGVSMNEPLFEYPSQVPAIEAVDEFKLQNALYPAEFGSGVGQVSIAMKSGTNELHGSLWDFLRNDDLQKFQPRFHTKTPLKQNQFGFVTGGPVFLPKVYDGRNRTFFFVSYNGGRRASGSYGVTQMPIAAEKQGNFGTWPTQLFDPLSAVLTPGAAVPVAKTPFAGNQIPASRFSPQSANLLKYWPTPTFDCQNPCNNYTGALESHVSTDQYSVRADHNFSANDRIFWQFLHATEAAPIPNLVPLSGLTTGQTSWMSSAQWTHVFSPRLINELRLAYNHFNFGQTFETEASGIVYWQQAGLKNLDPGYAALPAILTGTQYSSIGNGGSVPFLNISNIQQYVEHLSFITGKHNIKMGVDYRRGRNTDISGFQGNGVITFNGEYTAQNPTLLQVAGKPGTGNGFADFLLGYASLAAGTPFDSGAGRFWNTDVNLFVQDDIRLTPQLTVNLGMRWEYRGPWYEKSGGGKTFDYSYPGGRALYRDKNFVDQVNNPIFASCCTASSVYNPDYKDFAPRFGLAWRPLANSSRIVVRSGYGIFYDVIDRYYDTLPYTINQPYILPTLPSTTGLESQPPLDLRTLFPAPLPIGQRQFVAPYCQAPATSATDPATGVITVTNQCFGQGLQYALPNNKTPYTQNWGLNLQIELRPRMLLEVGYQGSHGLRGQRQAESNNAILPPTTGNPNNSNQFASQCPPGTYPASCSPLQSRVPYSNFIPQLATYIDDNASTYHALTSKLEQRFSSGLQLLTAFTYSKTMDSVSEIQTQGGDVKNVPQYAYAKNLEHAVAAYDQTLRFITSALYEVPFGKGKHWLNTGGVVNALLGGWQANSILTFASGLPYTISCECGDRSQTGNDKNVERENLVGNPFPSGFQKTIYQQFNTAAFATPALGTLGTVGRNTMRGPGQRAVDLSLFKNFQYKERFRAQFRAEAFNLMASPYYTNIYPGFNASGTDFGSLVPAGGDKGNLFNPRIYQMALRFMF